MKWSKKIQITNKGLLSFFILQFFFFQIIKMGLNPNGNWYFSGLVKIKLFFNSLFSSFRFSIGDIVYCILVAVILYWLIRGILELVRKDKNRARTYSLKILLVLNIIYGIFMLSFGLLYNHNNFPQYNDLREEIYTKDLKIVAARLLADCRELREAVTTNKKGEFSVDKEKMIDQLYLEQNIFYGTPKQKPNVKESLFSSVMRKTGIAGYYNPFTGEAQVVTGYPDTSFPFTVAHEMGHQVGVASENEANFYSFMMGESSTNKEYQYSVKYKALMYVLGDMYGKDSVYVNRSLENFSEGMKKDRNREREFYAQMSGLGSGAFSFMNDVYLKSNSQSGVSSYNEVVRMIVSFYKKNHPHIFEIETLNVPEAPAWKSKSGG